MQLIHSHASSSTANSPCLPSNVQTLTFGPWLIAGVSQISPKHLKAGKLNEDSFAIGKAGNAAWIVVADGMSAAGNGAEGSRLAVATVNTALTQFFTRYPNDNHPVLLPIYKHAHRVLQDFAKTNNVPLQSLATTLSTVLIKQNVVQVMNIGDGHVTYIAPHTAKPTMLVTTPQHPSGNVYGIQLDGWDNPSDKCYAEGQLGHATTGDIIVATDGADLAFSPARPNILVRPELQPYVPHNTPAHAIRDIYNRTRNPGQFSAQLLNFVNDINHRGDDCTFVYAIRTDR